ncbi:hypothetical protein PUN28_004970 [Cardiocondyla obscurior]|uniref:Uncharacterized protein n=1 Tax=Cardiocondyla obscurior TaxID=286306 RepID=A0AAW2GFZ0_9HYME
MNKKKIAFKEFKIKTTIIDKIRENRAKIFRYLRGSSNKVKIYDLGSFLDTLRDNSGSGGASKRYDVSYQMLNVNDTISHASLSVLPAARKSLEERGDSRAHPFTDERVAPVNSLSSAILAKASGEVAFRFARNTIERPAGIYERPRISD